MSYSVIHMQKFKMGAMKGIENHNERLKESLTNPDIVGERSHLNYDLHGENDKRTYYMRIRDRITNLNLPKAVRKDAVVSVGFLTTSDKAFFDGLTREESQKFFQVSYEFLKDRYGSENVISSKVHLDERTPHMHTYVVPVTSDGRLSAKSIFTKSELKSLQSEYNAHMRANGFDLEKGESTRTHIEMAEFKKQTAYKALESVQNDLKHYENLLSKANNTEPIQGKKALLNPNKVLIDASELDFINELKKNLALYQDKIIQIKDFERKSAHAQKALQSEIEDLKAILQGFEISERKLEKELQAANDKYRNLEKSFDLSVKKALQEKGAEYLKRFDDLQEALKNAYVSIDLAKESILKNEPQEAIKFLKFVDIEKGDLQKELYEQIQQQGNGDWNHEL